MLVLNTFYRDQASITNSSGLEMNLRRFKYGEDTEVKQSCSVLWHGDLYVFGGGENKRQISKVHSCGLYHYGTLRFPFDTGACANFNDERVYLCFNFLSRPSNQCHMASSPGGDFSEVISSNFDHACTRIAANDGRSFHTT